MVKAFGVIVFSLFVPLLRAQTCAFAVGPDSLDFDAAGTETKSVTVVASAFPCSNSTTALISVPWVHAAGGTVTDNVATYNFVADANTGTVRVGSLSLDGKSIAITQAGVPASKATTPIISAFGIVNGASFVNGAISPGEVVVITGDNMGPATLASGQLSADGKTLSNLLSGTQVLFNGRGASIVYTSKTQVGVVAPYEISDGSVVQIEVEYQGTLSNLVAMPVSAVSPALFALNGAGTGQGVIFNQSGSVNSATAPAHPGEVLVLFGTGDGVSSPLPSDGQVVVASTLPHPVLPVQVSVGGESVTVAYAGGSPGSVSGVLQINVMLPADVRTGQAIPVVLTIGGVASPAVTAVINK